MYIFIRRYCTQYDKNLILFDVIFAIYSLFINIGVYKANLLIKQNSALSSLTANYFGALLGSY